MLLFLALATLACAPPEPPRPFELKDGDRLVWIGSTLVEREQRYGYWETALYAAFPRARFTVHNLGWSGDTVWGESRGRFDFDKPEACFKQLVDQVLALKPTVILVSYGAVESFEGEAGLAKFEKGMEKLLDALKPANTRLTVLMSPLPYEISRGAPGIEKRNRELEQYSKAIARIAQNRGLVFADLFGEVWKVYFLADKMNGQTREEKDWWYTDDGVQLRGSGYDRTAHLLRKVLCLDNTHGSWGPEALRQAVIAKNELFFHRWRPQNETYLFGFRKHEQGKNAKEVAEFDPLVAKAEEEIDKIRKTLK
jgi:lysophospholipase L1-like esterase